MYGELLVNYVVGSLLFAWFLSLFGVDEIIAKAVTEIFKTDISTASYYIMFLFVGVIVSIVDYIRR